MLKFQKKRLAKKNIGKVIAAAQNTIDQELTSFNAATCKSILMPQLEKWLFRPSHIDEASSWPDDFDYTKMAYKLLYHLCFNDLSSGEYHIYRGMLSPAGEALYTLIPKILSYYESNGMMEGSSREEQLDILLERIESVG